MLLGGKQKPPYLPPIDVCFSRGTAGLRSLHWDDPMKRRRPCCLARAVLIVSCVWRFNQGFNPGVRWLRRLMKGDEG